VTSTPKVEDIILTHAETRGIDKLRPSLPSEFCLIAARDIVFQLGSVDSPTALIATGFYVNGAPETDGPPGAYFLYQTLKSLGFSSKIITDALCAVLFDGIIPPTDLLIAPYQVEDEGTWRSSVFEYFSPTLLIAVECCGRTRKGNYCDMRKNDISPFTAPIDTLFLSPPPTSLTIGIGDGGNEIGMGKLEREITHLLDITPCIISTTHLVIATVSNWGAWGLIRYLELLTEIPCLPSHEAMAWFLDHIVSKGAVDGISGQNVRKVDGYTLKQIKQVLSRLKECWL